MTGGEGGRGTEAEVRMWEEVRGGNELIDSIVQHGVTSASSGSLVSPNGT